MQGILLMGNLWKDTPWTNWIWGKVENNLIQDSVVQSLMLMLLSHP